MRPFPRTARRRLAAAVAAAALVVGGVCAPAAPVAAGDDLKDKKHHVEKKIGRASTEVEHSSRRANRAAASLRAAQARLDRAQGRLRVVEARLTAAQVRDQEMQEKLAEAIERLAQAQEAVDAAGRRLEGQREQVADVVSTVYEEGDPELYAFASFLDAQDPADLTRRVEARRAIVGEETRAYDGLRAAEVLLVVQEDRVEAYRDEVSRRRAQAADHLDRMEALRAEAARARSEVVRLVARRSRAQAQADAARRADQRVLDQLKAERQRIGELLRRRAEAARRAAARRAAARQQAGGAPQQTGGARVSSGDGYLSYPVSGPVTSPYGYRVHPIYGYYSLHDGTDFGAGCGAPLYASAPGTVISSYYQTAYGNRLIIDYGAVGGVGLASIYNHATSYTVGVGEHVERGQVIGYVGTTGWSTGCHLHFTVLVNGRTVDPMGWL